MKIERAIFQPGAAAEMLEPGPIARLKERS
jgi:hypothetical protein